MEYKVVEESKSRLVLELKKASHGLCNALVKELWKDNKVKAAAYKIDHPLVGIPRIILEVAHGNDAKKTLQDALKRLIKDAEKFKKEFSDKVKR
ncbi:DNA-directed RNA polymerase subunit L [Candidatus Woesearchaeota archaeon]|nr:MAG: DNA-directed RNA polymerase subunit L [Candidatus Woesearchaeota archaeon]